jgi:hypothetical protein
MQKQLWGYKVEDKLYVGGLREQKRLNTTLFDIVNEF